MANAHMTAIVGQLIVPQLLKAMDRQVRQPNVRASPAALHDRTKRRRVQALVIKARTSN
jgi:hypothetical protein